MKHILFVLLIYVSACTKSETEKNIELSRWKSQAKNIEIIRDDFGVPHIYGKTDADAVFGLLYAQCEDDFNRVEQNYIWAIGRRAEVEGEEAIYSDLRVKLFMTKDEAIANYEKSPVWLKKLCDAFADGINYYLYTHPEVKPELLTRFEPWMPMYFSEGSIGGDIERISTKKIGDFYGRQSETLITEIDDGLVRLDDNEPRGSNGFAISGKLTASGNAMLLINPHTSFFFRGEVHVISEEGLNVYGAVTWGQFFVYQGFNEKMGWMHTSTYADFMDEFLETVSKHENGHSYKYGEEERSVESQEVTIQYQKDGEVLDRNFTIHRTHHGPVTHEEGDKWVATAMMWNPVNALIQSFTRTKLSNHIEFRQMMDMRTNSSNNTVYADADGMIGYYHGNFIPKRNVQFDYTKPVDGSDPATDWQGLHSVGEIITVFNPANGWIQNCNSTPYTGAGDYSPKLNDYPNYMSVNQENFRGVHATRLLRKAENLTLDKLIEMSYDPYIPAFEVAIPGLIDAFDELGQLNEVVRKPIEALRNWDYSVSKESVAMSLAHFYCTTYLKKHDFPTGMSRMEKIIYMDTLSTMEERLAIFNEVLTNMKSDFTTWNTPWGEINRYQRINGDIKQAFNDSLESIPVGMASGRWGALASFGARPYNTKRLYGTSGNSFVAVVEFGEKLKAKTLLAGGQSGDPSSVHFSDQSQRYANCQFKDVAYYKEDVLKRASSKYHPGK